MPRNLLDPHRSVLQGTQAPKFVTTERWALLLGRANVKYDWNPSENRKICQNTKHAVTKKKIDRGGSRGNELEG